MKDIRISSCSDVGMEREKNEDSIWAADFKDMAVLVVADGMGGYLGGQMASGIVVQSIQKLFVLNRTRLSPSELIEDSFVLANEKVRELSHTQYEGLTLGSTCVMAVVLPPEDARDGRADGSLRVLYSYLGDSRLYLIRGSSIQQISVDHTMLQKLLESGALSASEAANYSHKNVIYKSINGEEKLQIEPVRSFDLERGDVVLLCSDGLSNYVRPEEIVRILQGTKDLDQAVRYMVHLANARGGDDNISVVSIEHGAFDRLTSVKLEKLPPLKRRSPARRKRSLLAALAFLLAASSGMLYYLLRSAITPRKGASAEQVLSVKQPEAILAQGSLQSLFRSKPAEITEQEAQRLFKEKGFFSKSWNTGGSGSGEAQSKRTVAGCGIVVDEAARLFWHPSGSPRPYSYDIALLWVENLNLKGYAGFKDWRLPTIEEASSLIESIKKNDKLYISSLFSAVQTAIWTCDLVAGETHLAWAIDFEDGNPAWKNTSQDKTGGEACFVRPVRSTGK